MDVTSNMQSGPQPTQTPTLAAKSLLGKVVPKDVEGLEGKGGRTSKDDHKASGEKNGIKNDRQDRCVFYSDVFSILEDIFIMHVSTATVDLIIELFKPLVQQLCWVMMA